VRLSGPIYIVAHLLGDRPLDTFDLADASVPIHAETRGRMRRWRRQQPRARATTFALIDQTLA